MAKRHHRKKITVRNDDSFVHKNQKPFSDRKIGLKGWFLREGGEEKVGGRGGERGKAP